MRLEHLYYTNFKAPVGTTDARIIATMLIEEQQSVYCFVLTEWKRDNKKELSLWQYHAANREIAPIGMELHEMAVFWLMRFAGVFEEARFAEININEMAGGAAAEEGTSLLQCGKQSVNVEKTAILYMGQDIFGMTCHANMEDNFSGRHYNEEFTLKIDNKDINAEMLGICIRDELLDGKHYLAYCAETVYRLKNTASSYLTITDWRQPFQLMEFVVKVVDPEMNVEIQDYDRQKMGKHFLGVRKLQNFILGKEEEIYIGDVTITRSIGLQGEMPEEFRIKENLGAYMWVKVTADTLYEAYQKIWEALECAAGILNLLVKNDSFVPVYSKGRQMQGWHYPFHENIVYAGEGIYIENCDTAESLYYGGEDGRKQVIRIEESVRQYLEDDNELDAMFNLWADGGKHQAFLLMLRWFEAGCAAENLEEKVVYLDMALEFAMSGERGTTFLQSRHVEEEKQTQLLQNFSQVLADADLEEELQGEIARQIENTLAKNSNFMSKLECFIETERIAVSDAEMELIKKMRKKRNAIAHGKRNAKFSKREVEAVAGVISNILLAKVYKVVRENEHN